MAADSPRRRLILTGAACLAVGLAAGWWLRPSPSVTVDETATERMQARAAEVFHGSEEWVTRRELTTDTHQVRTERHGPVVTTWPDGRREERGPSEVVVETGTKARETETTEGTRTVDVERIVEVDVVREVERRVEVADAKWALGPAVGFSVKAGPLAGAHLTTPPLGPFQFSALVAGNTGEAVGFVTGQLRF